MRILFLALEVENTRRDSITYNFIVKEMLALQDAGVDVSFLSFKGKGTLLGTIPIYAANSFFEKKKFLSVVQKMCFFLKNFYFFIPLLSHGIRQTLWSVYCELAIVKCVEKYKIDLIHTHFFSPNGTSAVVAKKKCNIPVVATCRGAEIYNLKEFGYGAMRSSFYSRALKSAVLNLDAITVPNIYYKNKFLKMFPDVDCGKVSVVYNGVEKMDKRISHDWHNQVMRFVSIGNLIPIKNHLLILKAIDLVPKKYEFKIIIVGNGPLKNELKRLVQGEYSQRVEIQDEIPKKDLFKLIAQSDCMIHPSFFEGGANVILEGLSFGVPCLASDIPSMQKEIIRDGINGFLFSPDNPVELAERIVYAIENIKKISKMGEACKKSVEPYLIENKVNAYLEIYETLLVKRPIKGKMSTSSL